MIVESMNKSKITISFSRKVGSAGIKRIKQYIEMLELDAGAPKKKISKTAVKKIADEIAQSGWAKFKKERGLDLK